MKVFIFTLVLFSGTAFTEVDIVTLDDFSIYNVNEHDLVIAKNGKTDRENFLGFRMERPFCILHTNFHTNLWLLSRFIKSSYSDKDLFYRTKLLLFCL